MRINLVFFSSECRSVTDEFTDVRLNEWRFGINSCCESEAIKAAGTAIPIALDFTSGKASKIIDAKNVETSKKVDSKWYLFKPKRDFLNFKI